MTAPPDGPADRPRPAPASEGIEALTAALGPAPRQRPEHLQLAPPSSEDARTPEPRDLPGESAAASRIYSGVAALRAENQRLRTELQQLRQTLADAGLEHLGAR